MGEKQKIILQEQLARRRGLVNYDLADSNSSVSSESDKSWDKLYADFSRLCLTHNLYLSGQQINAKYRIVMNLFKEFINNKSVSEVVLKDFAEFYQHLVVKYRKGTARTYTTYLRHLLLYASVNDMNNSPDISFDNLVSSYISSPSGYNISTIEQVIAFGEIKTKEEPKKATQPQNFVHVTVPIAPEQTFLEKVKTTVSGWLTGSKTPTSEVAFDPKTNEVRMSLESLSKLMAMTNDSSN